MRGKYERESRCWTEPVYSSVIRPIIQNVNNWLFLSSRCELRERKMCCHAARQGPTPVAVLASALSSSSYSIEHTPYWLLIIIFYWKTTNFSAKKTNINITAFIIQRNSIEQELKEKASTLGLLICFTVYARNDNWPSAWYKQKLSQTSQNFA